MYDSISIGQLIGLTCLSGAAIWLYFIDVYSQQRENAKMKLETIKELLSMVHGISFATVNYSSPCKLAAANKARNIVKVNRIQAQIFSGLTDVKLYVNRVQLETGREFEPSQTWFEHDPDLFSLVYHKETRKPYLWVIVAWSESPIYFDCDAGEIIESANVAALMTPSEARKLQSPSAKVYNVANAVEHSVIVRTIALENITHIRAKSRDWQD